MTLSEKDLYKLVVERARRAERTIDAARMVVGPLSAHDDLLAAIEDVCRQLQQTREALAESTLESGERQTRTDKAWCGTCGYTLTDRRHISHPVHRDAWCGW
jgi:hypothetical protein